MPNNISTPGPTGVEGAGGIGGHGRASRSTTPSRRLACTHSGRAAAHGHAKQPGPTSQALRRPEHPWGHKQTSRKTTNQEGPEGLAAAAVGDGRAWPGFETTRQTYQHTRPHRCGGRRRDRRARAGFEARRRTK